MAKHWHFCEFFSFYPTLDYHKIKTRANFKNPNGKSLNLHLKMRLIIKKLFPSLTDFTAAIFKIPQKSKHFSVMLTRTLLIQQKITEKVGLYTNNTWKVTVSKSWTIITLEKEMKKSFIIIRK